MYCPTCGSEERQRSQFCRACGTDLRSVRVTLERPDTVTASAVSARDQISRAIADKIRETQSASELQKVAEDVLPEIEKFLESPEEKRLRRIRSGLIIAFIGIGAAFGGAVASDHDPGLTILVLPGAVAFCIGLAILLNGLLFTIPRKKLRSKTEDDWALPDSLRSQSSLDTAGFSSAREALPDRQGVNSVTEHTTKHLAEKQTN